MKKCCENCKHVQQLDKRINNEGIIYTHLCSIKVITEREFCFLTENDMKNSSENEVCYANNFEERIRIITEPPVKIDWSEFKEEKKSVIPPSNNMKVKDAYPELKGLPGHLQMTKIEMLFAKKSRRRKNYQ